MLKVESTLYALLFSSTLLYTTHCQPISETSQKVEKTVGVTDNKKENDTAQPAFTYNYPTGFSREMEQNPFRAMQEMLAAMEQRFKSMFGNSNGGGMFGNSGMFGNESGLFGNGMTSYSSVFSSSSNGGDSLENFFGSNFFQQPCKQNFNENELVVKCNVSSYNPDEVKVDVKGNLLTITGKRVEEVGNGNETAHNSTTQFQQSIYLSDYNMDKMTSDVKDGLLTVTVPRIPHSEDTQKIEKKEPAGEIA